MMFLCTVKNICYLTRIFILQHIFPHFIFSYTTIKLYQMYVHCTWYIIIQKYLTLSNVSLLQELILFMCYVIRETTFSLIMSMIMMIIIMMIYTSIFMRNTFYKLFDTTMYRVRILFLSNTLFLQFNFHNGILKITFDITIFL